MQPAAAFVHDFIDIGLAVDDAARALQQLAADGRLGRLVEQSWRDATTTVGAPTRLGRGAGLVGDGNGGGASTPALRVEVGPSRHRGDTVVTPVSWSTDDASGPPRFDADFELSPCGPSHSQLHAFGRIRRAEGDKRLYPSGRAAVNAADFLRRVLGTVSSAISTDCCATCRARHILRTAARS